MAKKKKTAGVKTRDAIKKSIERSKARTKERPPKPIKGSREELITLMGEESYQLGCIQEELRRLGQIHDAAQQKVQSIKAALDKLKK
jgi:hypothetical protein